MKQSSNNAGNTMDEPWKQYAKQKQAWHKRTNTVWLYLYEVSRVGKVAEDK
jgi:hypothetical protein